MRITREGVVVRLLEYLRCFKDGDALGDRRFKFLEDVGEWEVLVFQLDGALYSIDRLRHWALLLALI